jgi:hypothetical protein
MSSLSDNAARPVTWRGDVAWQHGIPVLVMGGCGVVVVRESLAKWVGTRGLTVVYHN